MNRTVWIISGAVLLYFLAKNRLASNIKVIFKGLSFSGGIKKPTFLLRFAIQNPTGSQALLQSLTGQVEMNGKTIADVSNFEAFNIEPNSEKIYTVKAVPSGIGLAATLVDYFRSQKRTPVNVMFTGTANVDNINIPLSNKVTL